MDKNQAVIEYLRKCPQIKESKLFLNFADAKDESKQIVTQGNDKALDKPYIDGSVLKQYTLALIDFRSIVPHAMPNGGLFFKYENLEELFDVQAIIDWITEQDELRNYPDFGNNCIIEEIKTFTDTPNLNGIDTSVSPALGIYSISIQIKYLDLSNKIWKGNN